jgi:hypothetical protein
VISGGDFMPGIVSDPSGSSSSEVSDFPLSVAEAFLGGDLVGAFEGPPPSRAEADAMPSHGRHTGWVGVY